MRGIGYMFVPGEGGEVDDGGDDSEGDDSASQ
jgi:hypothetical protein